MSTVDFQTALKVAANEWPEDRATKIFAYLNAWDGQSFKVIFEGQRDPEPSEFLRELKCVWLAGVPEEVFKAQAIEWWAGVKLRYPEMQT